MMDEHQDTSATGSWDDRTLCPDESCIGTIGDDGCCRECGRAMDTKGAATAMPKKTEHPAPTHSPTEDDTAEIAPDEIEEETDDETDTTSGWDDRTLCRDESCIGTIGPDGCCNVCGLTYHDNGPSHEA